MALKILLADDSMTAQNMGKKILADAGYDVVAVSNGAAAIKKIASERPDIIILDVYMPGYTGLEVCERIKGARETAATPVLLTVGKMEPFKPEDANKVKADGVMVKPFEATDLIAAVQSIGNRLTGGAPQGAPKAPDTTVRIPTPVPAAGAAPQREALRIPPPREAEVERTVRNEPQFDHEATIRLTPEQVKAFQDATYKDWVESTDESGKAPEKTVAIPAAMQELEVKQEVPVLDPAPEQPIAPTVMIESPVAPVENTTISRAIGTHDIFTMERPATASPLVTELIEPEIAINTSVIYEPASSGVVGTEASAQPFFSIEPTVLLESPQPVVAAVEREVDAPVEVVPEVAVVAPVNSLELETSAPIETRPEVVEAENLEPQAEIAPVMEVVAETAPELEINSPIHLQPTVEVQPDAELEINSPIHLQPTVETETDPALIPSDGDMSQFVTTFGVEKPEDIAVGIVSDLTQEQQAAIVTPAATEDVIEVQAVPVFESAAMEAEPVAVQQEVSFAAETTPTSVMDEVGAIETAASAVEPEVVAYVPGLNDTQRFVPAAILPEDTGKISAEEPVGAPSVVEAKAEPVPQPEPVVAYDPADAPTVDIPASVMRAAAGAAFAGEHVVAPVPSAPIVSETVADLTLPVEESRVEAEEPVTGDAELAEELAAALEKTQPEPVAQSEAVEAAIEPVVAAVVEPMAQAAKEQGWSDSKLSDAVARAIEHLKPQLISEILKELTK